MHEESWKSAESLTWAYAICHPVDAGGATLFLIIVTTMVPVQFQSAISQFTMVNAR